MKVYFRDVRLCLEYENDQEMELCEKLAEFLEGLGVSTDDGSSSLMEPDNPHLVISGK